MTPEERIIPAEIIAELHSDLCQLESLRERESQIEAILEDDSIPDDKKFYLIRDLF